LITERVVGWCGCGVPMPGQMGTGVKGRWRGRMLVVAGQQDGVASGLVGSGER